jgi:hypothetical protein
VVLLVEADPGSNRIRLKDQWVSIDIGGESKVQNDCKWQKLHNTVAKLLGEVNCLSVIVEDKELVHPELDEQHEEIHDIEGWHST